MASPSESIAEPFFSDVARVRKEIADRFLKVHQLITEREGVLMSELEELETLYSGVRARVQIDELNRLKEFQVSTLTRNENRDIITQHVSELADRIDQIKLTFEARRSGMRRVELVWDESIGDTIEQLGTIEMNSEMDFEKKSKPQKSANSSKTKTPPPPATSKGKGLKAMGKLITSHYL